MTAKNTNEQLVLPTLFAVIQCIILFIGYNVGRLGFNDTFGIDTFKTLGLSFFVVTIPYNTVRLIQKRQEGYWYNSIAFITACSLLSLVVFNYIFLFLHFYSGIVFPILGCISLLYFVRDLFQYSFKSELYKLCIPAVLFALWSVADIWGRGYQNTLYLEGLAIGKGHVDTLFHADIAQMIRTYGVPGTGIDGIIYNPYHFGSHVLAQSFSSLLNIPVLKVYQLTLPLVYAPLYTFAITICALSIGKLLNKGSNYSLLFWFVLIIGLDGFLPANITGRVGIFYWLFSGESYAIGLLFSFLFIGVLADFWNEKKTRKEFIVRDYLLLFLILPGFLAINGFLKISILCLLMCVLGYLFLRVKMFRQKEYLLAFILLTGIFFIVAIGTSPFNSHTKSYSSFFPFAFVFSFVKGYWKILFMPVYYLGPLLYIFLRCKQMGITNYKTLKQRIQTKPLSLIDVEILLVFALVGFGCIAVLQIPGGSVSYFSDYQRKFSVILILVFLLNSDIQIRKIFNPLSKLSQTLVCVLLLCFFLFNTYAKLNAFYMFNRDIRVAILQSSDKSIEINSSNLIHKPQDVLMGNVRYKMVLNLMEMDKMSISDKRNSLLFIPQKDTLYWKALPVNRISFLAPALTGIAMVDGTPPILDSVRAADAFYNTYFYPFYQFRKTYQNDSDAQVSFLLDKVKHLKKSRLVVWNDENGIFTTTIY